MKGTSGCVRQIESVRRGYSSANLDIVKHNQWSGCIFSNMLACKMSFYVPVDGRDSAVVWQKHLEYNNLRSCTGDAYRDGASHGTLGLQLQR
jgi:hypothetical protein